ncbi:putative membrane protein At3g27390 [Bidens hawaiensis]|uniref:putative membrane protein At3g27390 n=1 Tax=Bidens hawaiensis TaxID=980011 RepID=UPI004049E1C2
MKVPVGFIAKLWSFISFLPFFFLLLTLGILKGIIIGPVAAVIMVVGNSSVAIGLWPAHFFWTYYCVIKTKRIGWVLKMLLIMFLVLPLVLWPVVAVAGSLLGGVGYGFFAPVFATFEVIGTDHKDKCFHCFVDGCYSTLEGSCMVVRDFADICFHSYFSFMDDLSEEMPADEKPVDIRLSKLPKCLFIIPVAIAADVPLITVVALYKSPYMLIIGWKRLLEDLIGREGPFLETVCVPFAGLAIMLWPLAVVGAVIASLISSFGLAAYSAIIVHQEDSVKFGFAYVVSVVSLFDEYTNDLLYLREGSCFPRPRYRENMNMHTSDGLDRRNSNGNDFRNEKESTRGSRLVSQRSRTLKHALQQYTPVQVWDWLFKSCEVNGRILFRDGLINVKDIEECIVKGKCKKLGIKLPAWSILQCLLASAKSESCGLVISDEMELTRTNLPRDKVFEWFIGPLLIMKEQIKGLELSEHEEMCLRKLVMRYKNEKPEDWDDSSFPSSDHVRRAQLQSVIRRLQGIVGSLSRMPTFRRRFRNLVKVLYLEALQAGIIASQDGGGSKSRLSGQGSGPVGEVGLVVAKGNLVSEDMV